VVLYPTRSAANVGAAFGSANSCPTIRATHRSRTLRATDGSATIRAAHGSSARGHYCTRGDDGGNDNWGNNNGCNNWGSNHTPCDTVPQGAPDEADPTQLTGGGGHRRKGEGTSKDGGQESVFH